ncbi:SitI3 family protein [Micromonospora peucetia]|uniref:SitI3 family protein n=1 Tax=Micromonospora peucetia TaxID=47871 RepID=UPI002252953C|nr:SitI3 family protein [Micromonospora peucetia]MCX4391288.1 SitI3 family protein [Micromonospora peucetia]
MSITYRLTLAGDIPLDPVAALAAPGAVETPTPAGNRLLSANLDEECGFVVSITSGSHGYYEAETDGAVWVWEPVTYVDIGFHMRKDTLTDKGRPHMLRTVGRVLANRPEDAALVLNDNWLMLTRVDGTIRRHNEADWYDEAYDSFLPR